MKNKKGLPLIIFGAVLILFAGIFALYNIYESNNAGKKAEEAASHMLGLIDEAKDEIDSYTKNEEVEFIPDYILNPEMDMPAKEIDGHRYIGVLEIPSLGITLPVLQSWSNSLLKVAPCRYEGSAYTGGLIIAAHNYSSHFANIKNLQQGELLYFTDTVGNSFEYAVAYQESLKATDIEEMKAGEWDMTLFTCTPGGQFRVTVRCVKVR